ncbi:hypothetical protein QNO09_33115 [Streptomyces sp. 378]|uniref:hypothetical protein n=1 Tax=Streptomyces sp. 378 TaxID=3049412 RepID=UPI0024C4477A|nr:hypothetical protein [Streptomyces sp. 378]MDK1348040.1 hypothetical protein [Streptomyces sp. 378]
MARFGLTPLERCHVENARKELAAAQTLNLLDENAMARTIGRLEVAVERLIEMVDAGTGEMAGRCPAAHPEDLTPCTGPVVVTVLDAANSGAGGCEHHAARLLASITAGRPVAMPDAPAGIAVRIFRAAHHMRPYPWREERA